MNDFNTCSGTDTKRLFIYKVIFFKTEVFWKEKQYPLRNSDVKCATLAEGQKLEKLDLPQAQSQPFLKRDSKEFLTLNIHIFLLYRGLKMKWAQPVSHLRLSWTKSYQAFQSLCVKCMTFWLPPFMMRFTSQLYRMCTFAYASTPRLHY